MWRSQRARTGRRRPIDFQLSIDAIEPHDGHLDRLRRPRLLEHQHQTALRAHDGNNPAFRTTVSATLNGLSPGDRRQFWIAGPTSTSRALMTVSAVDDFSLTPRRRRRAIDHVTRRWRDRRHLSARTSDHLLRAGQRERHVVRRSRAAASGATRRPSQRRPDDVHAGSGRRTSPERRCARSPSSPLRSPIRTSNDPPDDDGGGQRLQLHDRGVVNVCSLPYTPIYAIQGSGTTAAMTGTVTTAGRRRRRLRGPHQRRPAGLLHPGRHRRRRRHHVRRHLRVHRQRRQRRVASATSSVSPASPASGSTRRDSTATATRGRSRDIVDCGTAERAAGRCDPAVRHARLPSSATKACA